MSKKNIEIVHYPSLIPYIIIGVVYVIGTFIFPMYKFYSYIILMILSIIVYVFLRKMNVFKDQIVEIEKPIQYEYSELEEICQLGYEQVEILKNLVKVIDNLELINNLNDIIHTSEAILILVEDNQSLFKKVRKYFHYYLAEVIRILQQYDDFENDSLNSENTKVSKEKIEVMIAKANKSFLDFYNDLYAGKAMDVNVDLKVFDSMLKKLD